MSKIIHICRKLSKNRELLQKLTPRKPYSLHINTMSGIIRTFLGLMIVCAGLLPCALARPVLESVLSETRDERTYVTLTYSEPIKSPNVFSMSEGKPRIIIDIHTAIAAQELRVSTSPQVLSIRNAARAQGTRVVLDVVQGARRISHEHSERATVIIIGGGGSELFSRVLKTTQPSESKTVQASHVSSEPLSYIPIPRIKPFGSHVKLAASKKHLIVIDAGHGGRDPGAIGAAGSQEKAITLKSAQELKKLLLKTGRYDVYLTRDKDVYVDHYERVRLARMREADLFISLHADALDNASVRGASVYTLAAHAQVRSTNLVNNKQNWIENVDLSQKTDAVGSILVNLAQKKTFSNSHKFAQMLIPEIEKVAPVLRNTHRQKGLAVLLAPDVPAVLFEMGYISNAKDEKALNSNTQRRLKMQAVVKTINRYFSS